MTPEAPCNGAKSTTREAQLCRLCKRTEPGGDPRTLLVTAVGIDWYGTESVATCPNYVPALAKDKAQA